MNKKNSAYILRWAKKIKAIGILGGSCKSCGNDNIFAIDFHHVKNKSFKISAILKDRWSKIEKEISKCKLLCRNCHREKHYKETPKDSRVRDIKIHLLEFYGKNECEQCGYDSCIDALEFHHKKDKIFKINSEVIKTRTISEKILDEINKCALWCSNCHNEHHVDIDRFNMLKDLIYDKSKKIKERRKSLVDDIVYLKNKGLTQKEITIQLKCAKSTVSRIWNM